MLFIWTFRYHPIDDDDELTETSVGGRANSVVLRSTSQERLDLLTYYSMFIHVFLSVDRSAAQHRVSGERGVCV